MKTEPLLKKAPLGDCENIICSDADLDTTADDQSITTDDQSFTTGDGKSADDQSSTTGMVTMTANFVTCGLGVGILSLPWSAAGASVLPAAAVNGVGMFMLAYTCCIIAEGCEKYQTFDLGALVRLLPGHLGPLTEGLVNFVIWVTTFMCLIGYMIVVADSVLPMLSGGPLDSRVTLIVLTSLVCLPLCYLEQRYLAFSSWLAIAVNVFLFIVVVYLGASSSNDGPPPCYLGFGKGIASMFNTLLMALCLQMLVPPMYETLERRSVTRFRTVVYTSFGFLFVLFTGFQTVALYTFGPNVPQDVLSVLPGNALGNAVRYGMIVMVLGVYPLNVMPMVAPVRNAEWGGKFAANAATFGIVVCSMLVSFFVTQLGILNILNGAIVVLACGTLAPGLVGLHLVDKSPCAMFLLIGMGVVLFVCGFLLPENYAEQVQASCLWK